MKKILFPLFISLFLVACSNNQSQQVESSEQENTTSVSQELKHVEWSINATIYEANIRQMTPEGTFKALEAKLPEIKDLGVKIIWLMPIQPIGELNRKGGMGSYYSVMDYTAVNPEFGTMDDFKSLVNKAHKMDMKILLDWVANHTSWDNVWIADHPDWFTKDSLGNFMAPNPDWSDVMDLNYDNMEMRAAMIDAMRYWVVETDVDGFRCDVAYMVPTDFWNNVRIALDAEKPVFMLAEAEQTDLHLQAFDMTYGWELMHIMNHIASGDSTLSS
ncbi:MAG: alpha-amylase, partial [Epsilonproteobacteria bacterium]